MLQSHRTDQSQRLPLTTIIGERFSYRFAFDRSADSIKANEPGQDYIAIIAADDRIAFVLCDGVSQSFYGDLAARILGDQLVAWLWENGTDHIQNQSLLTAYLSQFLSQLTEFATQQVSQFVFPPEMSSMLQNVLEKKRALGSEATFTSGLIDLSNERCYLSWMGDSRLRIWDKNGEKTHELLGEEAFQTSERWSTRRGMVGKLHSALIPMANVIRLTTYSDGLARLDHHLINGLSSDQTLTKIIEESKLLAGSDDISFLEISFNPHPETIISLPKAPSKLEVLTNRDRQRLIVSWSPVKSANQYEVAIQSPRGWQIISTDKPYLERNYKALPWQAHTISVRAWIGEEVSEWSKPIKLQLEPVAISPRLQEVPTSPAMPIPITPSPTHQQMIHPPARIPLWKRIPLRLRYGIGGIFVLVFIGAILVVTQPNPPPFLQTATPTPTAVSPAALPHESEAIQTNTTLKDKMTPTPLATQSQPRNDPFLIKSHNRSKFICPGYTPKYKATCPTIEIQ